VDFGRLIVRSQALTDWKHQAPGIRKRSQTAGVKCENYIRRLISKKIMKGEKNMTETRARYYKMLFLISSAYDILLGIIFIFFYKASFDLLRISEKLPQFGGYLSLIGAFLFVIGVAYYLIYLGDLIKNRDLILVGILYKLAYCTTTFFYFVIGQVPHMLFVSLFGVIDFIMFLLMMECYIFINKINKDSATIS
jgi:hypothetical protein